MHRDPRLPLRCSQTRSVPPSSVIYCLSAGNHITRCGPCSGMRLSIYERNHALSAYIDDLTNGRLYMNAAGYCYGLPGGSIVIIRICINRRTSEFIARRVPEGEMQAQGETMPMKPFSMESREKIARIDNHRNVFRDAAVPHP